MEFLRLGNILYLYNSYIVNKVYYAHRVYDRSKKMKRKMIKKPKRVQKLKDGFLKYSQFEVSFHKTVVSILVRFCVDVCFHFA